MNKITKAIKLVSGLTEEEKQEFAEFFKQEEVEEPETKKEEPKVEVAKVETKQEPKVEEKSQIDILLEQMGVLAQEVKTLKEVQTKTTSFGAKPKQGDGKSSTDFDDIFKNLK